MSHPLYRRLIVEELSRLRRPHQRHRYAVAQRRGRIDPNPHQIDAVMFALRRIPEGGCILADEVGLGKTIEAGLVISQMLAEGARRVLLILPRPLLGQWRSELYSLFGIESREVDGPDSLIGDGVFIVGREFAGGDRGSSLLRTAEPFDLCVIDEAHEIFAGIYKRYKRTGELDEESKSAKLAFRVKQCIGAAPVLVLTATPIQNSLAELWGLVQYVEPTGTLLGNIQTFRDLFCEPGSGDRVLAADQAEELRQRINQVCQRTLRRQAAEFLERPFTQRQAKLFQYDMQPAEQKLYDEVTQYLMEPKLCAFRGSSRRLLLISFHRLMASSLPALAKGLEKVATRLEGMLSGEPQEEFDPTRWPNAGELAELDGIEDEPSFESDRSEDSDNGEAEPPPDPSPSAIRGELARVQEFAERARSIRSDSKAACLLQVMELVIERGLQGQGSGKAVIFTESLTTQAYLAKLLAESDLQLLEDDITCFRGVNDSARARAALKAWREDVGDDIPEPNRPSQDIAVRLALVHEFQHRSRIFISTEAGAKGLNLQFCDTIINYDLPWNPQRIEQRIGRCHRYGQDRDVTVINFLSRNNEAQRLTFEILSEKLDLFGQVLDASDVVLHESTNDAPESLVASLGADFETQLRRIYDRARSTEELQAELHRLADDLGAQRQRFEETQQRMQGLIQSRLDESVRSSFRQIREEMPICLAEFDQLLENVVVTFLESTRAAFTRQTDGEGRTLLELGDNAANDRLPPPLRTYGKLMIGHSRGVEDWTPLHLGHALVEAAIADARSASSDLSAARVMVGDNRPELARLRGARLRYCLVRLRHDGFEPFEEIVPVAILPDGGRLEPELARALVSCELQTVDLAMERSVDPQFLDDAIEELIFENQLSVADAEQQQFEQAMRQLERFVEDQLLLQKRRRLELLREHDSATKARDAAIGADDRRKTERRLVRIEEQLDALEKKSALLESREDEDYQRWRQRAHERRYDAPRAERLFEVELEIA